MKIARVMHHKNHYIPRKLFGYVYYQKRFIFCCPCNSLLSNNHKACKFYFTAMQRQQARAKIDATLSFIHYIIYNSIFKKFQAPDYQLTNLTISLINIYGKKYYYLIPALYQYEYFKSTLVSLYFKYSHNKKLACNILTVNNVSSNGVDRSNIIFYDSLIHMENKLKYKNMYYMKIYNKKLLLDIKRYSSELKNNYKIHDYELKNKIPIPVTQYRTNKTPEYPTVVPKGKLLQLLKQYVYDTKYYTLPRPSPPPYCNPFDVKHKFILDSYFDEVDIDYDGNPPILTYDEAVNEIEKLYPNKKYIYYDRYKDVVCWHCGKKGHTKKLCEDFVDIEKIKDPVIYRLCKFCLDRPTRNIDQRYGKYSNIVWTLPKVTEDLDHQTHTFWQDYGYPNPFEDRNKYWIFGESRSRNVGFWWAIGTQKMYLLKLIVGYESLYCIKIPRMQLLNHKSLEEHRKEVMETIDDYISMGICKIIPKSKANVIMPMGAIVKPDGKGGTKTRLVLDAKCVNHYIPSMKFKPEKIDLVKSTVFKGARVCTQDGLKAFFQLKVPKRQALDQCVEIYHDHLGWIVLAFLTVIFGGKNSCYAFKKLEDQLTRFFIKIGLLMNVFYDDSIFYAQNTSLSAAVVGSFVKRIYYKCGRLLNEDKTNLLRGTNTFQFCGYLWNTKLMKFRPLDKLITSTVTAIDFLLNNFHKIVPIKTLVTVIGKLMYSGIGVKIMSVLLIPLKEIMRYFHRRYGNEVIWYKKFKVDQYLCDHLLYLRDFILQDHTVPIVVDQWDYDIITDVSDRLAGSYDSDGDALVIPLPEKIKKSSSCLRETYGVYVAILNRLGKLKGKCIRVLIDNLGTATIIMRNGSTLYELNQLVYKIIRLCTDNQITIWIRWLRRDIEAIQFADDLSKSVETDRWLFDLDLFNHIIYQLRLPYPTIDYLADKQNAVVSDYYSRYEDGFALGCNWMNQLIPRNSVGFLNPPFRGDYLTVTVDHIINKRLIVYVLLPVWPAAPWYFKVLSSASSIILIPEGSKYFKSPDYYTTRLSKKWDVYLIYFSWKAVKKKYYKYNELTMKVQEIKPVSLYGNNL